MHYLGSSLSEYVYRYEVQMFGVFSLTSFVV